MHLSLTLTTAVVDALKLAEIISAGVFAHLDTTARATPMLGIICQNFRTPHPHLHLGEIVLRYEYDADVTTAAAAALELQSAADYLVSFSGLAVLNSFINPSSIWLRSLTTAGGTATPAETGERTRSLDIVLPFRCQTKF